MMLGCNLLVISLTLTVLVTLSRSDPHVAGKKIPHDASVIDCSRYKREANQHQCVLSPITIEGPAFILDDELERSDITEGKEGIPFNLTFIVTDATACQPIPQAKVHIWMCDALGIYSGLDDLYAESVKATRHKVQNDKRFLRGFQVSDDNGEVSFQTIIPGWYPARTSHVHVEVTLGDGGELVYIGQFYFPEELSKMVATTKPYSDNKVTRLTNEVDIFFLEGNGREAIMQFEGDLTGLQSTVVVGLDPKHQYQNSIQLIDVVGINEKLRN